MIEFERTRYRDSKSAIDEVRERVFVDDQSIPAEIVWDDRDEACAHVVAFDRNESGDRVPVGAARIDLERGGKIGRVAVVPDRRRTGLGRRLMEELVEIAS